MTMMDTNKDGKLSKKEVKGPLSDDFSAIDSDNDNFISKVELQEVAKNNKKRLHKGNL
jgi:Ca2+-binding EF-hand superfamily protein